MNFATSQLLQTAITNKVIKEIFYTIQNKGTTVKDILQAIMGD